jgi:hypothetical protein
MLFFIYLIGDATRGHFIKNPLTLSFAASAIIATPFALRDMFLACKNIITNHGVAISITDERLNYIDDKHFSADLLDICELQLPGSTIGNQLILRTKSGKKTSVPLFWIEEDLNFLVDNINRATRRSANGALTQRLQE